MEGVYFQTKFPDNGTSLPDCINGLSTHQPWLVPSPAIYFFFDGLFSPSDEMQLV